MRRFHHAAHAAFRLLLPLAAFLMLYADPAAAQQDPLTLYSIRTDLAAAAPLPDQERSRTYIQLNREVLDLNNLSVGIHLELQAGGQLRTYRISRISKITPGTFSVLARDTGDRRDLLSFTLDGNRILGSLHLYGEAVQYRLSYDTELASNYLAPLARDRLDIVACPTAPLPSESSLQLPDRRRQPQAGDPDTGQDPAGRIDVLVLYTDAAEQFMENISSTGAFIAEIMNRSQTAVDNSDIGFDFNLVHSARTSYSENPNNSSQTLNRLTDDGDGHMDQAHDLRDEYGADLVALLASVDDVGGIAWLINNSSGASAYGFSVNRVEQLHFTYTLAHELGHNMGNHHSRNQSSNAAPSSGGVFDYSTGWRWTGSNGTGYVSVMTYEEGDFETPYFSNPDVNFMGTPTGSYNGTYAPADNARSMREMQEVIADYRSGGSNPPPPPPPPPNPPQLEEPDDGETGLSRTPQLSWSGSSGADDYRVQVATSSGFGNRVVNTVTGATTLTPASSLNFSTTYYWRVQASNENGDGDWSDTWAFTTTSNTPSTPQLSAPTDGALGTMRTPELTWGASDRADSYRVQVSASSSFSNPRTDMTTSGTGLNIDSALEYFTTYYWRVRASNQAGDSDWSDTWEFTTTIATPQATSPGDGQEALPRRPDLDWTSVPNADVYVLQVSREPSFASPVINETLSSTSFRPASPLLYLTTYHWRVKARNESTGIESEWSDVRSFKTVIEPPEEVSQAGPADQSYQVPVNPVLRWHSAARAAKYTVQLSRDGDFSEPEVTGTVSDTAFTVNSQLDYATAFHWRVRASNEGGTGDWSEIKTFTTIVDETEITMNYPNPFHGETAIRYQLAMETDVRLEVFDTIGRQVKLLVDESQEPKVYEYAFDGSDLASGVYVVRLVTDNTMEVLMMTKIR
ncbi:MAG: M12 family metallo-peptidase [Balneolaceae bacterium]|nr:M12 family metallo-peptidase [Balneolaceae bacterium]